MKIDPVEKTLKVMFSLALTFLFFVILFGIIHIIRVNESWKQFEKDCLSKGGEILEMHKSIECVKPGVILK